MADPSLPYSKSLWKHYVVNELLGIIHKSDISDKLTLKMTPRSENTNCFNTFILTEQAEVCDFAVSLHSFYYKPLMC
jgi:hypothetical protein